MGNTVRLSSIAPIAQGKRLADAQAVLDLRAIRINGQWETSWGYHRQQQHERRYAGKGSVAPQWELTFDSNLFNWAA